MVLNEISTLEFLKVFPKVFSGTHVSHRGADAARPEVTLEADGIVAYADASASLRCR